MLEFKRVSGEDILGNNYILLYEYFCHSKDILPNNRKTPMCRDIQFKREVAVAFRTDDIFKSVFSVGENFYEYLKAQGNTKSIFEYDPNDITKEQWKVINSYINEWLINNGFPYYNYRDNAERKRNVYYNDLKFSKRDFIQDTITLYILFKVHKLLHSLDVLDYRNERDNKLISELNELKKWYLLNSPKSSFLPFDLNKHIPVITISKNEELKEDSHILDLSILDNEITYDNLSEISHVLKGLAMKFTYQLVHRNTYQTYLENGIKTHRIPVYSQSFQIDYQHIIYNKDFEMYRSYVMGYSLIGIAYYQLLINLTSHFDNGNYEMISCANPNCNNRFEKRTNKKFCNSEECQKYRKRLKSRKYDKSQKGKKIRIDRNKKNS